MPTGTPFPKGVSGNPAGRPVGSVSIKAELQKLLDIVLKGEHNPLSDTMGDMPVGRKVALNLVMKALADGDVWAAFRIMEQMDGKPAQTVPVLNMGTNDANKICDSRQ